jgi:hypothetical protein
MHEIESKELMYQPARTLTPVMNLTLAKSRLAEFQDFVKNYMVKDEDYGQIPGTPKPTLYKAGADKLCELYGLTDSYRVIDRIIDFDRGLFDYEIECTLSRDGMVVATGLGSCSSFEGKYRWRDSKQKCPECGKETIIRGKEEYGGGFICFAKKGGCGRKFAPDEERIIGQIIGQVENEDIATLKNTILKMAKKRSKVDATLSATRSAGVFTQDMEPKAAVTPVQQPQRKSDSAPANGNHPTTTNPDAISEPQRKRLFAIGKTAKYTDDQIKAVVVAAGYEHSADIFKKHYEVICEFISGTSPEQLTANLPQIEKWCKEN